MSATTPGSTDHNLALINSRREGVSVRAELSALVDSAACACVALFNSTLLAPHRLEPPQLSGDDEHMWIGLAP